ncbi:annexin-2 receptor-like [Cynocephalus volans]|uniref:annexin-2 receptor-like n=1 Tax=Cynocephalus volans TaxID=110931 RepID=UPI002FCAD5A7
MSGSYGVSQTFVFPWSVIFASAPPRALESINSEAGVLLTIVPGPSAPPLAASCWSEAEAMERHFPGCLKQGWDCPEVTSESQPPTILSSEDRGPWPVPVYPVLVELSCDSGDGCGNLLSSPWRLRWVGLPDGLGPTVRSTSETSRAQPTAFPRTGTHDKPGGPIGAVDRVEEVDRQAIQQPPWAGTPHPGDTQQDPGASDSVPLVECRRPPAPYRWSSHALLAGGLEWIRHIAGALVSMMSWGCCPFIFGTRDY